MKSVNTLLAEDVNSLLINALTVRTGRRLKMNELESQLKSYESYINDIPLVIDPCKQCNVYKKHNGYDIGDRLVKGVWKKGYCDDCCWCYDSKFEVK